MTYSLHVAHLYGDLMNTYGDIGNILVLNYYAKKINVTLTSEVVSLDQTFDPTKFDLSLFGGGQDYEQVIVSKDIQPVAAPHGKPFTERSLIKAKCECLKNNHHNEGNQCRKERMLRPQLLEPRYKILLT